MKHRLRELDRLDAGGVPCQSRTHFVKRLIPTAAAIGVVSLAGGVVLDHRLGYDVSLQGISRPVPLGTPPAPPTGVGGYAFSRTHGGNADDPVAYSPCQVLHVVVNDALAPSGTEGLIEDAIAEVSALTGLRFALDGVTNEQPAGEAARRREGEPSLIAWTTPEMVPDLEGEVAGLGGSTAIRGGQSWEERYVSGQIALDAPQLGELLHRRGGPGMARAVVLHELGHLVGLDHVADPAQLMSAHNVGVLEFNDGDRRGLARLGRGDCASR